MDYIFILLVGGSLVILSCLASIFWFGGFLLPLIFNGAPFVPTSNKTTSLMIEMAKVLPTDTVIDLGSGDGRLLIAAVEAGAQKGIGYEIHPGLVWLSRLRVHLRRLDDRITILQKSYWQADLEGISLVVLYQIPDSMQRLGDKLKRELPKGARVVSHAFPFPGWAPDETRGKILHYTL
ncbi:50S ribosomal protein L11 methyltransferase [Candidatus Uhrbacteria bacterium]|nr:50S ribosomal protein L11 methyltransferase [Candidatus Uhrbacteria bacterium]